MKEIRSIIDAYKKIDFTSTGAALATVVNVDGSSYRRTGARMLILDNGQYTGGISGGCLEGDTLRRAQKAIFKNKPSIITYDTTQEDGHQIGVGLGCNGIIDVLITPLHNNDEDQVRLLSKIAGTRVPRVLVSIIESEAENDFNGRAILYANDEQFFAAFPLKQLIPALQQDIHKTLEHQVSRAVTYETTGNLVKVLIELILPAIRLVLYGSNYDILPLTAIARQMGWPVSLVTNPAKVSADLSKLASNIYDSKLPERPSTDLYTAAVLMSHDYKTDLDNLKALLPDDLPYIGLLGPKKRSVKMFDELGDADKKWWQQNTGRIFSPCGLDIGASTPEEIALSIVAEIRAHFAGREGSFLRNREGSIYTD